MRRPRWHPRFALPLAVSIGILAAAYSHHMMSTSDKADANDFTPHWVAARALIAGESPYDKIQPGGSFNFQSGYLYPLPSAMIAAPFSAWLSPITAASLFVGVAMTLLAYGVARNNPAQLAMFGGIPVFWAAYSAQMSTIAVAGAVLPGLGWLAIAKPNLALALFAYRPTRAFIGGAIALFALSLIVQPNWIGEWLETIRAHPAGYSVPIGLYGGPLLLASLLRWRRPEARLLFVMSCIPQSLIFYDQLALGLIPRTRNESMILVITGFLGYMVGSWRDQSAEPLVSVSSIYATPILLSLYLPCLIMVLRRPNDAETSHARESPPSSTASSV